jgi:hypothetical protein
MKRRVTAVDLFCQRSLGYLAAVNCNCPVPHLEGNANKEMKTHRNLFATCVLHFVLVAAVFCPVSVELLVVKIL